MQDHVAKQVAGRIRQLREARGFSVRELARRSGVRPESILRSESGETEITITNLAKLCAALAVDLPGFFSFSAAGPAPDLKAKELRQAVDVLAALPAARRKQVVKGLELLLGAKPNADRSPGRKPRTRPA